MNVFFEKSAKFCNEMELARKIDGLSEYLRGVLLPAPEYGVCPVRALLPHLD